VEWSALVAAHDGRIDAAIDGFLEAASAWEGNDVRSEARCRWAAGALAARAGRTEAEELLTEAEDRAAATGSDALLVRIRRSLRSVGVVRRAPSISGVAGLTGREEAVLELVGAGRTTPAIAAELGVEPSTVESFVRSAMRKLGSETRVAAAIRWRELRDEAMRNSASAPGAIGDDG
jgi:DNA-binding NarL/FixJ family response regulator